MNKQRICIINGPNLNLLGKREPNIYGTQNFEDYLIELKAGFNEVEIEYFQSNVEGEIINKLHEIGFNYDGILLNAGGYSHTSVAIADALKSIKTPVIEIHISNIFAREPFRHLSLIGANCIGSISGFGLLSYSLGIKAFNMI
jgi:3-dehydroquinate dehydratase II